jgi:outer membrane protein OmpA-like peptidoglycan-associated protein
LRSKPILRDARGVIVSPQKDVTPSVDVRVHFAYDSAELDADAIIGLRALGTALADPALADLKFQIVGHTDARGSDKYNQSLSERRAHAVLDHLLFYYDLDAPRFRSSGAGELELFDPTHPEDGINRRTEIKNVTAME